MRIFPYLFLLCLISSPALAQVEVPLNPKPFGLWLEELKQEAIKDGISQATLDDAFVETAPIERIVTLDRKQPESTLTLQQYLTNVVTPKRIAQGRKMLAENHELLAEVGKKYGVQPRFIVALWGIETGFGANMGGFEEVDALATLAYDGRRAEFFRGELIKALHILEQEHMQAIDMKGSWAGAMGQCQFMPTSFLKYAVDYDGDGKRDIWQNKGDVFASIANYLKSEGWSDATGWGRPVLLPAKFSDVQLDITQSKPIREWAHLGVRKADGKALPPQAIPASVIRVGEGDDAVPYMIYGNYKVLLKWNRSRYFATAVGMLADGIGAH